ncbi:MAG: hypothetical protein ACYC3A_05680 [Halothiobacillus sp.]
MELFVNGWKSTLGSAGITSAATAIPVQVADAAKLPTLAVGDFIRAVLPVYDVNGQQVDEEIVTITAIDPATGILTVTRAQEGTAARGFAGSAPIFTGPTAGAMGALRDVAAGAAQKSQNLVDLADAPTARANLGLGSAATHAASDFSLAVQNNDVATTDPTVTDDSAAGYAVGSRWINKTGTGEIWRCIDATASAAKWLKTTLTLDELGSAATHAATDFAPAAGNAAQAFEGAAATGTTYFVNLGQLQNSSLGLNLTTVVSNKNFAAGLDGANFNARASGIAQGQVAGHSFYPTFQGTIDNGPRRAADIWGWYNGGVWGTETLSIGVGQVGGAVNDSSAIAAEVLRLTQTSVQSLRSIYGPTGLRADPEITPAAGIAIGASPFVYTNSSLSPMLVLVSGGSVSDVSIIRGLDTIPAGAISGPFMLASGDQIQISWSGTAPAMYKLSQ